MTREPTHKTDIIQAHFAEQADWCKRLGSPFTADLIGHFAKDLTSSGPVASLVSNWSGDPRADALALRLCAALHGGVLSGLAPDLAHRYPAADTTSSAADIWPIARGFLQSQMDWVSHYLKYPPQTNETARSIALLPGFLKLSAEYDIPMSLLELGASAGLNQNWDQFGYTTDHWSRAGPSDVLISTDWRGPPPEHIDAQVNIVRRAGCDINPLDIHDDAEALRLRSYVWPDQIARLARFDGALKLAQRNGTRIDKADALDWLAEKLATRTAGELTVIYHSVFLQYPPRETIAGIKQLIAKTGESATAETPLAWLCCEPEALFGGPAKSPRMIVRLQTWPHGTTNIFGSTDGHITAFEPS
jgi:hypothetical protein